MNTVMETAKPRPVASSSGNGAEFGVAGRPVSWGEGWA